MKHTTPRFHMAKRTMPTHRQRRPNEGYLTVPMVAAMELWEAAVEVLTMIPSGYEDVLWLKAVEHRARERLREAVGSFEDVLSRHARRAP